MGTGSLRAKTAKRIIWGKVGQDWVSQVMIAICGQSREPIFHPPLPQILGPEGPRVHFKTKEQRFPHMKRHLQCVPQYGSHLQRCASLASKPWRSGNAVVHLQFALQHASYLYRSTPPICTGSTSEKIPVPGGSGKFLIFCSQRQGKQTKCCSLVTPSDCYRDPKPQKCPKW